MSYVAGKHGVALPISGGPLAAQEYDTKAHGNHLVKQCDVDIQNLISSTSRDSSQKLLQRHLEKLKQTKG
ncbi:hypothetical protein CB1_001402005 [Camelus ferus]|nr:hypothetical protein CB1_001402005 [Camelus ferus]